GHVVHRAPRQPRPGGKLPRRRRSAPQRRPRGRPGRRSPLHRLARRAPSSPPRVAAAAVSHYLSAMRPWLLLALAACRSSAPAASADPPAIESPDASVAPAPPAEVELSELADGSIAWTTR